MLTKTAGASLYEGRLFFVFCGVFPETAESFARGKQVKENYLDWSRERTKNEVTLFSEKTCSPNIKTFSDLLKVLIEYICYIYQKAEVRKYSTKMSKQERN
jgi:hypothetical protein